jgi:alpha-beta hydrolase superfamily lysophospholipase
MSEWGEMLAGAGYSVLALNQRDEGPNYGFVTFAATCDDIRYGVDLLKSRGVERIVLLGRSYGTVLASCYLGRGDPSIRAGILFAPLRDIHSVFPTEEEYLREIQAVRQMVADGHGKDVRLQPVPGGRGDMIPYTNDVFLDKVGPDSKANTVALLKQVHGVPLLGIRDPADPLPGTVPPAQSLLHRRSCSRQMPTSTTFCFPTSATAEKRSTRISSRGARRRCCASRSTGSSATIWNRDSPSVT